MKAALIATLLTVGMSALAVAQQPPAAAAPKPPSVRCLTFSADGKSLAVAHRNSNTLVVWDVESHQEKFRVRESKGIAAIAFAPGGDSLAIATGNVVKLLDPATGELRRELNDSQKPTSAGSMAFTPDGKQLAVASNDRTVKLWDVGAGEVQHTFPGFKGNVAALAISNDGKWLATVCGKEDVLKMWHLDQPDQSPRIADNAGVNVSHVAFSPDSKFLLVPHWALIDVATGQEFLKFTHYWDANCAAFSPDGNWIALVTQYRPIYLLPFQSQASRPQEQQIDALIRQFQEDDYTQREAASRQLAALGTAAIPQLHAGLESSSAEVRIRCRLLLERLQNADFAVKLAGHETEPSWIAFSPDSKILASGDWQGIVKLWNLPAAKELATLELK